MTISTRPVDGDGVSTLAALPVQLAGTPLRYGRVWFGNDYRSDKQNAALPYEVQYWNGYAFIRNALDNCTALTTANVGLGNYQNAVDSSTMPLSAIGLGPFSGGRGSITLAAPNAAGSVDVVLRLDPSLSMCPSWSPVYPAGTPSSMSYLRGDWCGAASNRDPVARATFGISSSRRQVFLREGLVTP